MERGTLLYNCTRLNAAEATRNLGEIRRPRSEESHVRTARARPMLRRDRLNCESLYHLKATCRRESSPTNTYFKLVLSCRKLRSEA
eukprot:scaffold172_cov254-Pinguiococcus_pyrenoidosus.AAC.27